MPTIEERDSEADVREELERKEKEYRRNIERLEDMLDDLRRKGEELSALNTTTIEVDEPGDILELRDREMQALEQELAELEAQNISYEQKK